MPKPPKGGGPETPATVSNPVKDNSGCQRPLQDITGTDVIVTSVTGRKYKRGVNPLEGVERSSFEYVRPLAALSIDTTEILCQVIRVERKASNAFLLKTRLHYVFGCGVSA